MGSECRELEEYIDELESVINEVREELEQIYDELKEWCYDTEFLNWVKSVIDKLYEYYR